MKKTSLQKKWEKIASEPGWVENKDPAVKERILARNQKLRENKSASINTRIEPSEKEKFISKADEQGLKYQTFLGQLIYKVNRGLLIERDLAPKIVANKKKSG